MPWGHQQPYWFSYWKHCQFCVSNKRSFNSPHTSSVFVYCTNTRMIKIWQDIFSQSFFCYSLYTKHIPSIYQSYTIVYQNENLKHHIPIIYYCIPKWKFKTQYTNSYIKFKLKIKKLWAHLLTIYIHSSNIKKKFLLNYLDLIWTALILLFFFFVPNWVGTIKFVVLNRKRAFLILQHR